MSNQNDLSQGLAPPVGRTLTNRRASVRYHCGPATPGRVVLPEAQVFLPAWVLDLSKTGIGLQIDRELAAGQFIHVKIKSIGLPELELPAHVAHATARHDGEWVVGCELVSPLSEDELDALLR
jgi:hypothetical protein